MRQTAAKPFPLDLADRCVKCGLCLPHCPTYQITENEAESPRGRIALMQGLATGLLEQSTKLESHLDGCLGCRACESVCPAEVPYGELIDQGRAQLLANREHSNPWEQALSRLLASRWPKRIAAHFLWLYQRIGVQWLVRKSHILGHSRLARLEAYLPQIPRPVSAKSTDTQTDSSKGTVALFTGCVSEWLESDVLRDAVALLNACGFDVDVPSRQGCCGALAQHNGDLETSKKCADNNIGAFDGDYVGIVGIASGCTSMLAEYPLVTDNSETLSKLTQDISHFLLQHWSVEARFQSLDSKVAIHDPCSLKNVLRQTRSPYALLEKIPGLSISALDDNATCCGAAGSYFITQPDMADELGARKLAVIKKQAPDIIVTSNVGCGMQLKAQLKQAGIEIPVMHPISLLRRQLLT